tara:strand:+ start:531 stop:1073 length:543 start_codon:yes stop_codon:yes gene_type:complete
MTKFYLSDLKDGGFYIKPNFLNNKDFNYVKKNITKLKYKETYQPENTFYGNRYQAYPCYEAEDKTFYSIFLKALTKAFDREPKKLFVVVRKILTSELLKSKTNTKYGLTHKDAHGYAGVFCFDQTVDGGTAFFENSWDKYPDIQIGAYPNRLVVYNGNRHHAAMHDFTFDTRYVIVLFFD